MHPLNPEMEKSWKTHISAEQANWALGSTLRVLFFLVFFVFFLLSAKGTCTIHDTSSGSPELMTSLYNQKRDNFEVQADQRHW